MVESAAQWMRHWNDMDDEEAKIAACFMVENAVQSTNTPKESRMILQQIIQAAENMLALVNEQEGEA